MTAFTVAAARSLPGAPDVRARRAEAAERFVHAALPSAEEEVWRYSRIAELELDAYAIADAGPAGAAVPVALEPALETFPERAATILTVNGRVASVEVNDPGLEVLTGDAVVATDLGVAGEATDAFFTLNDAFAEPVVVRIARGATITLPIAIAHWSDVAGLATFPRLVVRAGEASSASVVEYHVSADDAAGLCVPVVELDVAPAARLGYLNAQNLGLTTWQISSQVARVDVDATLVSASAGFGGDYARQRTDCRLVGRGATGNLLAVYFGEGSQMLDFRTFQDHAAPDTTSNLLFKGAVGGTSRSVYTGLIRVRKDARGTNAIQTNRNIKLSEGAWAESVPNLEIENNDVRCAHASAVGPVDEDQRFYLESRGVPTPVAERLVVTGFFDEVLAQLPTPAAGVALRALVSGKLDRMDRTAP
ncbi:MAG: SufB/SufD family protein [Acidimicrobiales bacterium]